MRKIALKLFDVVILIIYFEYLMGNYTIISTCHMLSVKNKTSVEFSPIVPDTVVGRCQTSPLQKKFSLDKNPGRPPGSNGSRYRRRIVSVIRTILLTDTYVSAIPAHVFPPTLQGFCQIPIYFLHF